MRLDRITSGGVAREAAGWQVISIAALLLHVTTAHARRLVIQAPKQRGI